MNADTATAESPTFDLRVTAANLHVIANTIRVRAAADLRMGETLTKAQDRENARVHHAALFEIAQGFDALARMTRAYCERAGV